MLDTLEPAARAAAARLPSTATHWSVRGVVERSEQLAVRQDIAEAPRRALDHGAMVSVVDGGQGYAATADLSEAGLAAAFARAHALARAGAGRTVIDAAQVPRGGGSGRYAAAVERSLESVSLPEKIGWLREVCAAAGAGDARIVDRHAKLWSVRTEQLQIASDGTRTEQQWEFTTPAVQVTAQANGQTQRRSSAGQYNGFCQQGGLEVLERAGFRELEGPRVAREALELAGAATCPSGALDVILMPDQMMLQIHESIGHPLELDRILGDERNFAGTSFVTLDMFGHYRYGSELLNVSYDPGRAFEFAGFAFDDDGTRAERALLIERGVLKRALGGALSQARALSLGQAVGGVATSRSASWNRAPIDRMSNLNVEPGSSTLAQMIESTEFGVVMHTNCSWSIDDSRNKFQFGCEYARMVRGGQLAEVVRNPNYRGISATFWRSLAMVGDADSMQTMGTPYCGKGEPSQVIRVGHASPPCKFSGVEVFGGRFLSAAASGYTERERFEALADELLRADAAVDRTTLYLRAEVSDFLRFNHAALRQATSVVQQAQATLAVERGLRRAESTLSLCGHAALDGPRLREERALLVAQLDLISDDPWLQVPGTATHSQRDDRGALPDAGRLIARVNDAAGRRLKQDLVGFCASGPVVHAFADSLGSRHWHRVETFHFDWCLYQRTDKAVKTAYAGTHWDDAVFAAKLEEAAARVPLLAQPSKVLPPGPYRAALSPAAMVELIGTLGWSGFSLKDRRTGFSSLARLADGSASFASGFQLAEDVAAGNAPAFTAEGFVRPARVALVDAGRLPEGGGTLNSPRSAAEYGVAANGANEDESPDSLALAAGTLAHAELLKALDTGLYVSNLWYLNYSDRAACRMTGMTRYACFWVERGALVAPVDVMRFDDDALRLFGPGLVALTDAPEVAPDSDTYGGRQLGSVTTPGALVEGFRLVL